MIDAKKKRLAIARILNEGSSVETEAQKLGISARQVRRWVEATKAILPKQRPEPSPGPGPSDNVPPPEAGPEKPMSEGLKKALDASDGGAPGAGPSVPKPADIVDARIEMQKFCLDTVGMVKTAIGSSIVTFRYAPPLALSDAAVQDLLKLSAIEDGVIRANVQMLYPVLVKWMAGPYQLVGGLVVGQLLMIAGLDTLAKKHGWKDKPRAVPPPAPPPPPPSQAAPSPSPTAPAWTPPKDGTITAENRENGPFGQVSDAPHAPSPFILPPAEPAAK